MPNDEKRLFGAWVKPRNECEKTLVRHEMGITVMRDSLYGVAGKVFLGFQKGLLALRLGQSWNA